MEKMTWGDYIEMCMENSRKDIDFQLRILNYDEGACFTYLTKLSYFVNKRLNEAENGKLKPKKKAKTRHG